MGKPHISPNTIAQHPAWENPMRFPNGCIKGEMKYSPALLETSISESTMNGKREGTMVRAHKINPFLMQLVAISARRSIKARQKNKRSTRQIVPAFLVMGFFGGAYSRVILLFSIA